MDTSGYGALLVPFLIEKLPFNLRQNIAKKVENDIWELAEMLKILTLYFPMFLFDPPENIRKRRIFNIVQR